MGDYKKALSHLNKAKKIILEDYDVKLLNEKIEKLKRKEDTNS